MTKKTFGCRDIDLPHADMVALRNAGELNLGIDNELATKISSQAIRPTKTTASAAFRFWNFVGFVVLGVSIYWSFTGSWWWFIAGLVAAFAVWGANRKGNSANLLDAAMADPAFYERVRSIGGWLYQIDEVRAAKYRKT